MKGEVQVMTLNLPGTKFDRFQTIASSITRANSERRSASINTTGWCPGGKSAQRDTFKLRFTIYIVGAHGVIRKSQGGVRTVGSC